MTFHLFTKPFAGLSISQTADLASRLDIDGLDLCVREGHPVDPANLTDALPRLAEALAARHRSIGMVSAPAGFTDPDSPLALALCRAMAACNLKYLKLGYFPFKPDQHDYHALLASASEKLAKWARLAQDHNLTVCYHTHTGQLGSSAGTLAAMLHGLNPSHLCAYLDPAHLLLQGEGFPAAVSILQHRFPIVGLKDVNILRKPIANHGSASSQWVYPGTGMVDWSRCARVLHQAKFSGLYSVHALMHESPASLDEKITTANTEIAFYKQIFKDPAQ